MSESAAPINAKTVTAVRLKDGAQKLNSAIDFLKRKLSRLAYPVQGLIREARETEHINRAILLLAASRLNVTAFRRGRREYWYLPPR